MKIVYLTLLIAFFSFFTSRATIHYSFVNEDITDADRFYDLDLDGDNDFGFHWDGTHYTVNCLKPTSFISCDSMMFSNFQPKVYSDGAALGTHWWHSDIFWLDDFVGNSKYLSVKFTSGTDTLYGWIHLDDYLTFLYVLSFAYEDVPGQGIIPGDRGTTGIEPVSESKFVLSQSSPHHIHFHDCAEYDKVMLYTTEGKLLAAIEHPTALQDYYVEQGNSLLVAAFYNKERLLSAQKYFVR